MGIDLLYTPESLYEAENAFAVHHGILGTELVALSRLRERVSADLPSDWHRLAAWVVAPVLAIFTRWLAEQTEKAPGARCLAVMREGRLIGQLLKALFNMQAREVWINRNVSMRAAFSCGDDEALLNWLVRTRIKPFTAAEAARELSDKASSGLDDARPLDLAGARQLLADLQDRRLLDDMRIRAAALSGRLMRHWQSVMPDSTNDPILLMDFASVGNIQRSMRIILAANGDHTPLIGLNFLTTAGSIWAKQAGCMLHGCLAEDGEPSWMARAYARTPELIEIFAAAPEGPLQDYAEDGMPILGACILNEIQQKRIFEAHEVILSAAVFYHRQLGELLNSNLALCVWGRLLLQPLIAEVKVVADWPLDAGLDGSAQRMLAPKLEGSPHTWTKLQTAWPAGSRLRGG